MLKFVFSQEYPIICKLAVKFYQFGKHKCLIIYITSTFKKLSQSERNKADPFFKILLFFGFQLFFLQQHNVVIRELADVIGCPQRRMPIGQQAEPTANHRAEIWLSWKQKNCGILL